MIIIEFDIRVSNSIRRRRRRRRRRISKYIIRP
jgi:hypothetical protein